MPDNTITIAGNITRDPELKFLNSGQASVKLSVAVNRRWQNRQTQEWEERVSFFEVVAYGPLAENAANSLTKGTRVLVTGRLEQRSWETPDGDKRSVIEINADEIAPSLRFATAQITKIQRTDGGGTGGGGGNYQSRPSRPAETPNYAFDEEPF
jgi:single-strand DNA-binding protein